MIQPVLPSEVPVADVKPSDVEAAIRRGVHEALIRSAKLGFPAVGFENGRIVFWPPERVLTELDATIESPKKTECDPQHPEGN